MKILGIDTSANVGSVAICQDGLVTAEYTINYKKTHSQTLLVMIDQMCKMIECDIESVDAFAVSAGPGSFTGLRIGSTTAKGFGLALKKPIISVSTIEALAYNLYGTDKIVCPIMDARRNQVYTGIFEFKEGECITKLPASAMAINELIDMLNADITKTSKIVFLGDAVPVYKEQIVNFLTTPFEFAYGNNNLQRGSSVALLGEVMYKKGIFETAEDHSPIYLRLSQAERERMERLGKTE